MTPLTVPIQTVRLQTIRNSTSIKPASANRRRRVKKMFVHSKHWEVPNARLHEVDLHLPQRRPEHLYVHCSSISTVVNIDLVLLTIGVEPDYACCRIDLCL